MVQYKSLAISNDFLFHISKYELKRLRMGNSHAQKSVWNIAAMTPSASWDSFAAFRSKICFLVMHGSAWQGMVETAPADVKCFQENVEERSCRWIINFEEKISAFIKSKSSDISPRMQMGWKSKLKFWTWYNWSQMFPSWKGFTLKVKSYEISH